MDCKEFIERQSAEFKASFLEPFDIVILKNRAMKGKLGVKQKIDLSECLKKRKLFFECENSAPILNFQQYFDIKLKIIIIKIIKNLNFISNKKDNLKLNLKIYIKFIWTLRMMKILHLQHNVCGRFNQLIAFFLHYRNILINLRSKT